MKKQRLSTLLTAVLLCTGNFVFAQTGNEFVGDGSGVNNTTGSYNSFFGDNSGNSNTEGKWNSFFGKGSGFSNTTGSLNSFVGYQSGYSNTTGDYNSFVGFGSGFGNTTGHSNSFVGAYSGHSNTTGNSNSFVGFSSGSSNTTGHNNSFVGTISGYSNTTGYSNSFVGYQSGYSNTTGDHNSFLGSYSGNRNTTGSWNSFVGFQSGASNTTGYHNSFFGLNSGYNNIEGYGNSFFGRSSGYSNTAGSGNVFLGYQAGYYETGSNKLYIANSETDPPLIYGDFSTGRLGLGTKTPTEKLEVVGTVKATSFVGDGSGLTGISITESQISDLQSYITASSTETLTNKSGSNSMWTNDAAYITDGNTNWDNSYGFITGSSTETLTNKSGSNSMWTNDAGYLTSYTETDPKVGSNTANYLSKWNGTALVAGTIFDNATNVGIGTATPTEKLEVVGTVKATSFIGNGSALTGITAIETDPQVGSNTTNYLSKWDGTALVSSTVFDNGNVGIGTSTPSVKLTVESKGGTVSDRVLFDLQDNNNPAQLLIMGHTGGTNHAQITTDERNSRLTIMASNGDDGAPRIAFIGPSDASAAKGWGIFDYGASNTNISTAKMVIRYTSTAGVQDMFTALGNTEVIVNDPGNDVDFRVESDTDPYALFVRGSDGNIGLGASNPGAYKLYVAGDAYATNWYTPSDKRYKKSITTITSALDKVKSMRGTSYEFDTDKLKSKNVSEGKQYGFIAQELKEVLPELVSEDAEGFYAVNYDGVVPVLVEALKEQQNVIEEQNERIANLEQLLAGNTTKSASDAAFSNGTAELYQNTPNPFSQQTEIRYFLSDEVKSAAILVFDMNGRQLKHYELTARGHDKLIINGGEFVAGMYLYSLIVDKQLVATKRMVLTTN